MKTNSNNASNQVNKTGDVNARMKWDTIIDKINEAKGYNKFRYDSAYETIYELDSARNSYVFYAKTNVGKKTFIEEEA